MEVECRKRWIRVVLTTEREVEPCERGEEEREESGCDGL